MKSFFLLVILTVSVFDAAYAPLAIGSVSNIFLFIVTIVLNVPYFDFEGNYLRG